MKCKNATKSKCFEHDEDCNDIYTITVAEDKSDSLCCYMGHVALLGDVTQETAQTRCSSAWCQIGITESYSPSLATV